jgi:hypothetical protein
MDWCEKNGIQYVFGLSKNETLDALVFAKAHEVRTKSRNRCDGPGEVPTSCSTFAARSTTGHSVLGSAADFNRAPTEARSSRYRHDPPNR